jgi:hypothetical protein
MIIHKYPKGFPGKPGYTKIAVSFENDTFLRLLVQARKENLTFSDMCDLAVRTGLFDLEESDQHEPKKGKQHGKP